MTVAHFGNTANNAYFNYRILESTQSVENSKILDLSNYAMSAPAWDALDFQIPREDFVDDPFWAEVPGALESNDEFLLSETQALGLREFMQGTRQRRAVLRLLDSSQVPSRLHRSSKGLQKAIQKTLLLASQSSKRSSSSGGAPARLSDVAIFYGPAALISPHSGSKATVALEHGTVRWIRHGANVDRDMRRSYLNWLRSADHLWVTNLDDATLDLADELMPGRWSALPHPYFLDPVAPYAQDDDLRSTLQKATASEFLVFLPSSINWLPDHNKGSRLALESFLELRRSGLSIGLVAVRWGRQVADAMELLAAAKSDRHVKWIQPQPRIPMQRLMACVDVVWDQFHYGAFGGVTMKAMEQGVPVITHSVDKRGADLMGGGPPLVQADSGADLFRTTADLYERTSVEGRAAVLSHVGAPLRAWMQRHHGQEVTAALQLNRYRELMVPKSHRTPATIDSWATLLSLGPEERMTRALPRSEGT